LALHICRACVSRRTSQKPRRCLRSAPSMRAKREWWACFMPTGIFQGTSKLSNAGIPRQVGRRTTSNLLGLSVPPQKATRRPLRGITPGRRRFTSNCLKPLAIRKFAGPNLNWATSSLTGFTARGRNDSEERAQNLEWARMIAQERLGQIDYKIAVDYDIGQEDLPPDHTMWLRYCKRAAAYNIDLAQHFYVEALNEA